MNRTWSVGNVPLNENVQFMLWPLAVSAPATAFGWLNSSVSGSSTVSAAVVAFHVMVSHDDAASKLPKASVGCKANTYSPAVMAE